MPGKLKDGQAREEGVLRAWGIRVLAIARWHAKGDGGIDISVALYLVFHLFGSWPETPRPSGPPGLRSAD